MSHWISAAGICALALSPMLVHAQPVSARDPNDQIIREQQEKLREEMLRRSAPASIEFEQPAAAAAGMDDRFPEGLQPQGPAFPIHTIRQDGMALLPEAVFARVTAPFVGRSIGVEHINVLLERVNRALIAAGYTTSRAYVGNQSLQEGVLSLTIVPGRIEQLLFNGTPVGPGDDQAPGVHLALAMKQGDVLRLRDIEQSVDQFNRLRRNNVQVQIRPGTQPGGSIVEFVNQAGQAARYNVSLDNQGAAATGRLRVQLGLDAGNVLGLMESLGAGLTTSTETNALYGTFSMPLGYATLSAMASVSEYQNLIGDTALVHGTSKTYTLSLSRLLQRDQNSKTAMDLSFSHRKSERSVNNISLSPQTQAVLRLGINRLTRFQAGEGLGQWTVDAGISRGMPWLDTNRDPADLPREAARYRFTKLELSASVERPLGSLLTWRSRALGQWSRHPLYSSEQIFAGGVGSVRGFPESAVGGDKGMVWRNEWALQRSPQILGGQIRYEPYLFVDAARLSTVADSRSHALASAGGGLRIAFAGGFAELIAGKPLRTPSEMPKPGWRVNASLAYQF